MNVPPWTMAASSSGEYRLVSGSSAGLAQPLPPAHLIFDTMQNIDNMVK